MSFESRDYLRHILTETVFVLERSKGLSREEFLEDETLQRAFVRSLEVIGEAAKKLPSVHIPAKWATDSGRSGPSVG